MLRGGRVFAVLGAALSSLWLRGARAEAQSTPNDVAPIDATIANDAASADSARASSEETVLTIDADAGPTPDAAAQDGGGSTVQITMARVAIVDTAPIGVDPVAATFLNNVLREQFTRLGLSIVATDDLYAAARRLSLGFPVPEAGLAALVRELNSDLAITCELRARSGFYFATVRMRRRDESTETGIAVVATQWTLGDRVREAVTLLLRGNNRLSPGVASPSLPNEQLPTTLPTSYYLPSVTVPNRPPILLHARPFELSLVGHAAFNPGRDSYVNGLAGVRFAYFPIDRVGIVGSLSYANLRGRVGRVNNLLPLVGIESGVDLVPSIGFFVPLRFEVGYLPFNGIVARVTAGLGFTLYKQLRLEIDLVQPTLWMVGENASVTLDVGVALTWVFGRDRTPRQRRRRRATPSATSGSQPNASAPTTQPQNAR